MNRPQSPQEPDSGASGALEQPQVKGGPCPKHPGSVFAWAYREKQYAHPIKDTSPLEWCYQDNEV